MNIRLELKIETPIGPATSINVAMGTGEVRFVAKDRHGNNRYFTLEECRVLMVEE